MTDEEKKVLTKLKQIQCSCEGIFYNFEAGAVLNLIEKQQKEIEDSIPKEAIRELLESEYNGIPMYELNRKYLPKNLKRLLEGQV